MGRRWIASLLLGGALIATACSSPPPPSQSELVSRLGVLKSSPYSLTGTQVMCVAKQAELKLHGKALRQFAADLSVLDSTGSTTGMDSASMKTFTDAISTCAASG